MTLHIALLFWSLTYFTILGWAIWNSVLWVSQTLSSLRPYFYFLSTSAKGRIRTVTTLFPGNMLISLFASLPPPPPSFNFYWKTVMDIGHDLPPFSSVARAELQVAEGGDPVELRDGHQLLAVVSLEILDLNEVLVKQVLDDILLLLFWGMITNSKTKLKLKVNFNNNNWNQLRLNYVLLLLFWGMTISKIELILKRNWN